MGKVKSLKVKSREYLVIPDYIYFFHPTYFTQLKSMQALLMVFCLLYG
jgi:hypothetical protein